MMIFSTQRSRSCSVVHHRGAIQATTKLTRLAGRAEPARSGVCRHRAESSLVWRYSLYRHKTLETPQIHAAKTLQKNAIF
ncbi:hypothetical protein [Paraburkholderia tuberum]|uniref:hypothetical protein n=1 Tax=Paraburkholderia tuberum TaxID=157910 RepID=UPI00115FEA7E|nr:hypothetical protein [Paraburkholderia tuberum]